jgi:ketosteroid isomerase-like protein
MTHATTSLLETFYTAFQQRNPDGMIACYHPDIWFSDPVFGDLRGPRAGAMWRMLCERATSLEITFRVVSAEEQHGHVHWEARYPFSATGRHVHNVIEAEFELRDGKLIRHADSFDLWRWAGMALGPKGRLLGWLPPVRAAIQTKARRGLEAFEAGPR